VGDTPLTPYPNGSESVATTLETADTDLGPSRRAREGRDRMRFPEPDDGFAIPVSLFDTQLIEAPLRYDAWRQNMGVFFTVEPRQGERPRTAARARIAAVNLGEVVLGLAQATSQQFVRDQRVVVQEAIDGILVQFYLQGSGYLEGQAPVRDGDMLILDLAQPTHVITDHYQNLSLLLPKSLYPELTRLLERLHNQRLAASNPLVRIIREHLINLWHCLSSLDPQQALASAQGALGLLAGWLGNDPALQERYQGATHHALFDAITRYIDQHLHRAIDIAELTQLFRLSRTQLYRLFQPHGGVANYIWERRLQQALQLLLNPARAAMTLATIAHHCGFSSEVHFCRRFRQRFGQNPGQVRADALAMRGLGDPLSGPDQEHLLPFRRLIEGFADRVDTPT